MADRLTAMRRVAAVRIAQRAVARTRLHAAMRSAATAHDALATTGQAVDAAFGAWRAQAECGRFEPEMERRFAMHLIARTGDHAAAGETRDEAARAETAAQRGLHRAEAAVEQSGTLVARLLRADRRRRDERQLADHADAVTLNWRRG